MIKWEYKLEHFSLYVSHSRVGTIEERLNKYGVDGWELVFHLDSYFFFKRLIPNP